MAPCSFALKYVLAPTHNSWLQEVSLVSCASGSFSGSTHAKFPNINTVHLDYEHHADLVSGWDVVVVPKIQRPNRIGEGWVRWDVLRAQRWRYD